MDGASIAVVAVVVITFAIALFTRYNSVIVLALGITVAYVLSFVLTDGDMFVVWAELGYNTVGIGTVENFLTIITSSFLHKNIWHLLSNIVFLLIIGLSMRRRISNLKFLIIVFIGDISGTIVYGLTADTPCILIGASTIVATMIGAMLSLFPRLNLVLPKPVGDTGVEYWEIALIWICLQILMNTGLVDDNGVAYSAHMAGFAAGVIIGLICRSEFLGDSSELPEYGIDLTILEPYCVSEEHKRMYAKAMSTSDPFRRGLWIRNLARCIQCPKCGKRLKVVGQNFVCGNGHIIGKHP